MVVEHHVNMWQRVVDPVLPEPWQYLLAIVPAFLGFLLIAIETQITEFVYISSLVLS